MGGGRCLIVLKSSCDKKNISSDVRVHIQGNFNTMHYGTSTLGKAMQFPKVNKR